MLQFQHKVVHARYCTGIALLSVVFFPPSGGVEGWQMPRFFNGGMLTFP